MAQVKREMKQTSLMEEHKLCHHSRPTFEPFIKDDLCSEKKNRQILTGEKNNWDTGIWRDRHPEVFQIIIHDISRR